MWTKYLRTTGMSDEFSSSNNIDEISGISYSPQHNYAQSKTNQSALSPANKSHVTLLICDTQRLATQCNVAHEERPP
jgi:hypothetical protein